MARAWELWTDYKLSIPGEYFPAFTTALQRHRARFMRAAAADSLLHTVSPLLGVGG